MNNSIYFMTKIINVLTWPIVSLFQTGNFLYAAWEFLYAAREQKCAAWDKKYAARELFKQEPHLSRGNNAIFGNLTVLWRAKKFCILRTTIDRCDRAASEVEERRLQFHLEQQSTRMYLDCICTVSGLFRTKEDTYK